MYYEKKTVTSATVKERFFPHGSAAGTAFLSPRPRLLTTLLLVFAQLLLVVAPPSLAQAATITAPAALAQPQPEPQPQPSKNPTTERAKPNSAGADKDELEGETDGKSVQNSEGNNVGKSEQKSEGKSDTKKAVTHKAQSQATPQPVVPPANTHSAFADNLTQQLETDARQQLADYARVQRWLPYQAKFNIWLPAAVAHLPACALPVQVQPATPEAKPWGRISYVLRCSADPNWTLRARVTVAVTLPVWVAAEPLQREQALTPNLLRLQSMDISSQHRGFISSAQPPKRRLLRDLSLNQPLYPAVLAPVWLVEKKQQVVIEARGENFTVSTQGLALGNGSKGELVAVQNLDSSKRIQARVVAKNRVQSLR